MCCGEAGHIVRSCHGKPMCHHCKDVGRINTDHVAGSQGYSSKRAGIVQASRLSGSEKPGRENGVT